MVLVVVACVTGVVAAVTGAVSPLPGVRFLPPGHWVFNSVLQAAFHIDGATTNIDAQVPVHGDPDSRVVQGDTSGYVVGRSQITEFGKSTLSVEKTMTPPADETAAVIEGAGGPYAVYRKAGIVQRVGDPVARIDTGGPLGDPVITGDGTVWLFHTGTGLLCKLPRGATEESGCPGQAPRGHTGALTMVADRPHFVDTSSGTLHQVNDNGLTPGKPLGVRTSAASRPAATDVAGRLAILDPEAHRMHLVDAEHPDRNPAGVSLPDGDYDGPSCTDSAVVVVERKSGTVLTFDPDGNRRDVKTLPRENGDPRLSRGEDAKVYVEGGEGTHVAVVDKEGQVTDVPVAGKPERPDQKPAEQPKPADQPQQQDPRSAQPPAPPAGKPAPPAGKPAPPAAKPEPPALPATVPGAPTSVSASPGNGSVTVRWGPAPDNRSKITGYLVSWQGASGGSGSLPVGGNARTATVPNLTNGVRYTITVSATNKIGTGPAATANPVTPVAPVSPPGMPPNLTVTITTKHVDATVTWAAAAPNGAPVTAYHVSWQRDDGSRAGSDTVPGNTLRYVITGIWAGAPDVAFTVRVVAENSAGPGPPAVQYKAPPKPTITISRGKASEGPTCKPPSCAEVNTALSGFEPNTTYPIRLMSGSGNGKEVAREQFTTDANGSAFFTEISYDVPDQTIWMEVDTGTGDGPTKSNELKWD